MTQQIAVRVRRSGDDLKVVWVDPVDGEFLPYYILRAPLMYQATRTRDQLDALVDCVLADNKSGTTTALRELARAGGTLRNLFFADARGDQDPQDVAQWLDRFENGVAIRLLMQAPIHLPWGLMYDGSSDEGADDSNVGIDRYGGFWCLKYNVAVIYQWITPTKLASLRDKLVAFLPVVNASVYQSALSAVNNEDSGAAGAVQAIMNCSGPPLTRTAHLLERWRKSPEEAQLLYFYCHSTGSSLGLSAGDELTVADWVAHLFPTGGRRWAALRNHPERLLYRGGRCRGRLSRRDIAWEFLWFCRY